MLTKLKDNTIFRLALTLAIVIGIAYLLSLFHVRFDLTSEKRYTLSDFTKQTLRGLDKEIYLKVFLEGDLNIPFEKMKIRLEETLNDFDIYAGNHLRYEFINPFKGDKKTSDKFLNELVEKGLKPTNIIDKDKEGGSSEKLVIPGMLVYYEDAEIPVNFLRNKAGESAEENINSSMEAFEYELMRVIGSLVADTVESIAFIEGHGEFNEYQVGDITNELGWNFQVDRGKINGIPGILDQYKAIIIAGPQLAFTEADKYIIDQYIMQGGKVLWFIDMVNASTDSISNGNPALAMIKQLNIEDILFRYGIRINPILIQDIQCGMIPVNVALVGNTPDFRLVPWLYYPLLTPPESNPVTRNLNLVKVEFGGSIDMISARKGIKQTPLLSTSQFTRKVAAPVIISLDEVRLTPREEEFTDRSLPVAVLLEGKFESAFQNRMVEGLFPDTSLKTMVNGKTSAMLVVSDADIIRNDIRPTPQGVLISPLGFDRYTNQTYGNKEFIVNALQYMTGHKGLINLRSRELTIRLLDKNRIRNNRTKWILINTLIPPLIIILAGLIYNWIRKRKYSGT